MNSLEKAGTALPQHTSSSLILAIWAAARGVFPLAHDLETVERKTEQDQTSTSSLEDTKEGGTWEK